MIFNEQPTGRTGALSPIIYQAFDAVFGNAGFVYQFEIFVWTGSAVLPGSPVAIVNKKPDQFGGGRGWIDTRKIVTQSIERNILIDGTFQPNINSGIKYTAVRVTGVYDTGSTAAVTSNIELITDGYNYIEDGFNADFDTKKVYTDRTEVFITRTTPTFYLWFDAGMVSSIDIGAHSQARNAVVNSNELTQGIDIIKLLSDAGVTGTDSTVSFIHGGSQTDIEVKYECENRHGEVLIHYLNRYGTYESFVFNALSRSSKAIERQEYLQPIYKQTDLSDSFQFGVPIKTTFLSNSIKTIMANTNYLPEDYNTIIEQIIMSRNILLIDNSDVFSVRVSDSAFVEKKHANEKLIQYTVNLEFNQPVINDIAR